MWHLTRRSRAMYFFVSLLLFSGLEAWAADKNTEVTVLLTSFDHYQDPINSGQIVAERMKQSRALAAAGINVVHCKDLSTDDTSGKNAFSRVQRCIKDLKTKPDMVISFGESDCGKFKLETRFANVVQSGSPLDPDFGPEIASSLPLLKMYCANRRFQPPSETQSDKKPPRSSVRDVVEVKPSQDAGFITCNNSAFFLAQHFKKSAVPYGFIHVPRFSKECRLNQKTQKEVFASMELMILAAAENFRSKTRSGQSGEEFQPKNHSEALAEESAIKKSSADLCEKEFYSELLKGYAPHEGISSPPSRRREVTK